MQFNATTLFYTKQKVQYYSVHDDADDSNSVNRNEDPPHRDQNNAGLTNDIQIKNRLEHICRHY